MNSMTKDKQQPESAMAKAEARLTETALVLRDAERAHRKALNDWRRASRARADKARTLLGDS